MELEKSITKQKKGSNTSNKEHKNIEDFPLNNKRDNIFIKAIKSISLLIAYLKLNDKNTDLLKRTPLEKQSLTELKYTKASARKKNLSVKDINKEIKNNKVINKLVNQNINILPIAEFQKGDTKVKVGYNQKKDKLYVSNYNLHGMAVWKKAKTPLLTNPFNKSDDLNHLRVKSEVSSLKLDKGKEMELQEDLKVLTQHLIKNSPKVKKSIGKYSTNVLNNTKQYHGTNINIDNHPKYKSGIYTVQSDENDGLKLIPLIKNEKDKAINVNKKSEQQYFNNINTKQINQLTENTYLGYNKETQKNMMGSKVNGKISWQNEDRYLSTLKNPKEVAKVKLRTEDGAYILSKSVANMEHFGFPKGTQMAVSSRNEAVIKGVNDAKFRKLSALEAKDLKKIELPKSPSKEQIKDFVNMHDAVSLVTKEIYAENNRKTIEDKHIRGIKF